MKKKHPLRAILFLLILVELFLPDPSISETIDGVVTYVFDGDTVKIKTGEGKTLKIRLAFLDAPERAVMDRKTGKTIKQGQPYGEESFEALRSKLSGKKVRVDVTDRDEHNRVVGIVYLNGRDINKEMIEEGNGWAYRKYLQGKPYAPDYLNAESVARRKRIGLWREDNPVAPWKFKRLQGSMPFR